MKQIQKKNLAELQTVVENLLESAHAPNTRLAYKKQFEAFVQWCEKFELCPLPATEKTIVFYVGYLSEYKKYSTIRQALTAISKAHRLASYPDPVKNEMAKMAISGVARTKGKSPIQKRPITLDILSKMIDVNSFDKMETEEEKATWYRDTALICVGFSCALRRSEICNLQLEDIETKKQGTVVHLKKSKTDQLMEGRFIGIPKSFFAAEYLFNWISFLLINNIESGFLFRSINNRIIGNSLSPHGVSYIVKKLVKRAGYDPREFSSHSLRAGLATTASEIGISPIEIQKHTGHASVESLSKYVRKHDLFSSNILDSIL